MAHERGYRCPYTGKAFSQHQLVGYGNPPRSPACLPGTGAGVPMIPVVVEVKSKMTDSGLVILSAKEVKDKLWIDVGNYDEEAEELFEETAGKK